MIYLSTLIAGLLFGLGLLLSGMSNPLKVQNFLDVFGYWDPSLIFVMVGAISMTYTGYRWVGQGILPHQNVKKSLRVNQDVDFSLIMGAVIFGIGWGLTGLCPAPAITALPLGISNTFFVGNGTDSFNPAALLFFAAMIAGMYLARKIKQKEGGQTPPSQNF